MKFVIVILLFCGLLAKSAAQQLRCYACSFSSSDSDQSCLTISNSTNIVSCPFTYCTIFRQEYIDPIGVIASFTRGCEQAPDFLNHDVIDPTFRTFYRACTNNLCNTGNGIEPVTGGNLSPTPVYNGLNLLVPGTGGASNIQISVIMMLLCIFVSLT